jgi:hypothetical protein
MAARILAGTPSSPPALLVELYALRLFGFSAL